MQVFCYIIFFIIGSCFGSFLCCQARRLHYRETHASIKSKKSKTNKPKSNIPKLNPRSICLHCKKQLKWYDNIPIVSWLILRGRCRFCHSKYGIAELLSEVLGGIALLAIFVAFDYAVGSRSLTLFGIFPLQDITSSFWTIDVTNYIILGLTVIFTFTLFFLAIYDGLYGELPTRFLIISIILATVILAIRIVTALSFATFSAELIWRPLIAVLILGGLYFLLYLMSKGKWVGDGDWLLATAIALALASPWLALFTLFLANFFACLVTLPTMRISKTHKIHLGPFLVAAYVVVLSFAGILTQLIQ